MPTQPTRRTLLAAGFLVVAAGVAGCTKAVRATSAATQPSTSGGAPTSSSAANSSSAPIVSSVRPAPGTTTGSVASDAAAKSSSTAGAQTSATTAATSAAAPGSPAVQIVQGAGVRPQVALTFHGAGDPALAKQILQIVATKGVKITVMAVGTWLTQYPQMAAEILAGGHELGNHTWSHQDINSMSPSKMTTEVVRCQQELVKLTGSAGLYFRQSDSPTAVPQLLKIAGAAGYRVALSYSLDSMDWTDPGAAAVRHNMKAATKGAIVSMHLGHQGTVDALPGVLDDLKSRGLSAVTVSELLRA